MTQKKGTGLNGIKLGYNQLLINELGNHRRDGMDTEETVSTRNGAGADMGRVRLQAVAHHGHAP